MRWLSAFWLNLAIVAAGWTAWLVIVGGVDTRLFGLSITSNEPIRPFLVANAAFLLYVQSTTGLARLAARVREAGAELPERTLAALLSAGVLAVGVTHATTVAGGADSYGYVSQADLWLEGDLRMEQPWVAELPWPNARWTASPLGYRPGEHEGDWSILPTYSPGLPLLMAAAKGLFGHAALFWVVPMSGACLVLATFGIGRAIGSARLGLAGGWFVATSPIVLFMLMPPMTDVPVAAAWAAAACIALWPGAGWAALSGLVSALAILIRPNLAMLAAPLATWLLVRGGRAAVRREGLRDALAFAAGAAPGVAAIAWLYTSLYGSPFASGYGPLDTAFAWAHVWPNVGRYTRWFIESQTWLGVAGVIAIAVPLHRLWPFVVDRRVFLLFGAMVGLVVAQYLAYLVFDTWWFLRFLLPCWPYVCLGLAAVLLAGARHGRAIVALASIWMIVVFGLYQVRSASKLAAFGAWEGERTYPDIARVVRDATPEASVVFSLIHSGALRYYGGRVTLRFDSLDADWLDRAVEWLSARGVRAYALLEPWEVPEFEARFKGQRAAADLDKQVALVYRGINTIRLYDLSGPAAQPPREVVRVDPATLHAVPPVPRPALRFPR
jgi:hypothetical protein